MDKNTHLILFSALFLGLGFVLGRVTGHPHHRHPKHNHPKHNKVKGPRTCDPSPLGADFMIFDEEDMDVQVLKLTDDLDGDTTMTLPGGGVVKLMRVGDDVDVQVALDAAMSEVEDQIASGLGEEGEIRIEKRIVIVQDDENQENP